MITCRSHAQGSISYAIWLHLANYVDDTGVLQPLVNLTIA